MGEELLNQVALCLISGIGPVSIRQLITYCGSAQQAFQTSLGKLKNIPGVGDATARLIVKRDSFEEASKEIQRAKQHDISLLFYTSPRYPSRLKQLADAPLLLYTKGNPSWQSPRTLGIVGTRQMSSYGRDAIEYLLNDWSQYGPTIISGLAYGVDITAHRVALSKNLSTIAVLGHGLDTIYPRGHKATAGKMLKKGGLLSELKFGTKPDFFQFPKRNRIIAGLSDALIVVEAQNRGGALITAKLASDFGRPVFAVPGAINNPSSQGCLQLIQHGKATILRNPEDVSTTLNWHPNQGIKVPTQSKLTEEEQRIIHILREQPTGVHIDEISWKAQIPINRMGSLLLHLEFEGLIKCLPGKKFSSIHK